MLYLKTSRRAGAFALHGDYLDLENLYFALHAVIFNGACGEAQEIEEYLWGLPYDIRKARDGMRERHKRTNSFGEKSVEYRSVQIPVVRLIIQVLLYRRLAARHGISPEYRAHVESLRSRQVALNRAALANGDQLSRSYKETPLSASDQALLLLLEAMLADSISEFGIGHGDSFIVQVNQSLDTWGLWPNFQLIENIDFQFLYSQTTRRKRIAYLKDLPEMLRCNGPYHRGFKRSLLEHARDFGCSAETLKPDWESAGEPKY